MTKTIKEKMVRNMTTSTGNPAAARRFVLLGGGEYYACGGFNDFISSHDTLEEALLVAREGRHEWWHVWDCGTNSIVGQSNNQAHGASEGGPTLDRLLP